MQQITEHLISAADYIAFQHFGSGFILGSCAFFHWPFVLGSLDAPAAMSRLSEEFVAEFEELMTKELHMTSGEFFNGGKHILEKHKLLKQVNQILPKFF